MSAARPIFRWPTFAARPGYEFDSWFGLLGSAGVPRAEIEKVNAALGQLLKAPAVLVRLDKQGIDPQALSPDEFARLLCGDFERMAKVVKITGAKSE